MAMSDPLGDMLTRIRNGISRRKDSVSTPASKTEQQLTEEAVPYEAGVAQYHEITRGQLLGDDTGMLKLLIHQNTRELLGVHIIGTGATELVHIGQAVMGCGGTVEYLVDAVFNYPTFSEAYKVAALDVMNKLRALHQFRS